MAKKKFPTFAVILLIFGVIWFLSEANVPGFVNINVPWIPLILIVVATGWIFNRFKN